MSIVARLLKLLGLSILEAFLCVCETPLQIATEFVPL